METLLSSTKESVSVVVDGIVVDATRFLCGEGGRTYVDSVEVIPWKFGSRRDRLKGRVKVVDVGLLWARSRPLSSSYCCLPYREAPTAGIRRGLHNADPNRRLQSTCTGGIPSPNFTGKI